MNNSFDVIGTVLGVYLALEGSVFRTLMLSTTCIAKYSAFIATTCFCGPIAFKIFAHKAVASASTSFINFCSLVTFLSPKNRCLLTRRSS